jgi:hypothetical protein
VLDEYPYFVNLDRSGKSNEPMNTTKTSFEKEVFGVIAWVFRCHSPALYPTRWILTSYVEGSKHVLRHSPILKVLSKFMVYNR